MCSRKLFGLLGLLAIGMFALATTMRGADDPAAKDKHHGHNAHMQHCAKACADCMQACESCARHCAELVAEGHKDHLRTLGTCADCGDICGTASKLCARQGPMVIMFCDACAKACDTCGSACEKFPDDKHMTDCAKACRQCEKVCREMIEAGQGSKKD